MWQDEGGSEYYGGNDFAIYKYINSTHCPLETHSNVDLISLVSVLILLLTKS